MPILVSPVDVKSWLSDGDELAFLDVREYGQYGEAHPFFVIPAAYSVFESRLPALVPNRGTRIVLVDGGDGVSEKAAAHAEEMGYSAVHIMKGGAPAWGEAGYTLYAGVNVPSKTFGELLELERHTPRMTAEEVSRLQKEKADHVIVDGRPFTEYTKFNIPGGICCPNGELALRISQIAPDSKTTIVVNCAGRTRSILGAQTLIDAGITNPVYALENGTQGWFLAGLELERGAAKRHPDEFNADVMDERRAQVASRAKSAGVEFVTAAEAQLLRAESGRNTYLFDVRTDQEYAAVTLPGAVHAPGGQLVQATDQWVGVRGARIIVFDDDMVRAPMVAYWLRQLGHEAFVLDGGLKAAKSMTDTGSGAPVQILPTVKSIAAGDLAGSAAQVLDVRGSMAFRDGHIEGARWSIRPRLAELDIDHSRPVVLVGGGDVLALAAKDLAEAGCNNVSQLGGGPEQWRAAGLNVVTTDSDPVDSDCIDFLFFTSGRHEGVEAASRQYLEWEIGLVGQLDEQERGSFRIVSG